jgi:sterol O-acyltransferase
MWVQSGFFVLHTIAMLMKLHSYSFYNGELSTYVIRLSELKKKYANLMGESKKFDNEVNENERRQILDQLKEKIEQVEGYLHSPAGNICYPENVTFLNYIDFLLVPTLVYELEYPRTEK